MRWTTKRPTSTDQSLREMAVLAGPFGVGEVRGIGGTHATKRTKPDWYRGGHLRAEPVSLRSGHAMPAHADAAGARATCRGLIAYSPGSSRARGGESGR